MTKPKRVYDDEKTYVNQPMRIICAADLLAQDPSEREPDVIPHNTMRFDVHMGHIYGIFEDGIVTKDDIVQAIRAAIIKAADETIGKGLDGIPIPGGAMVFQEVHSVMLHRETISFDLS